jgi:hypothetical protein
MPMKHESNCTTRQRTCGFLQHGVKWSTSIPRPAKGASCKELRRDSPAFWCLIFMRPTTRFRACSKSASSILIRDLNDAVLDNPYDETIKGIATAFAELFREIVKTTDRWGLRSRFLRKHLADVARFYRLMSKMEHLSEAAMKLKARLDRERVSRSASLRWQT